MGRYFVRNVAMILDAYLGPDERQAPLFADRLRRPRRS